jgi:hypothetical protein
MILTVCPFAKYTFPLLDGVFTPKLMLPARKGGYQEGALMICTVNVQLWHSFLARGDTSDTFEICLWGLLGMEISILGSKRA